MYLFVGLGNPGPEYVHTRHNVGFLFLDELCSSLCRDVSFNKVGGFALVNSLNIENQRVLFVKPMTYMNLSGQAVCHFIKFYKILPENVFVFHDDLDIKRGSIRVKIGGSSGGHNGLKSIDSHIGSNYWRVRIGIGRPEERFDISGYVLGKISEHEDDVLYATFSEMKKNISLLLGEDKMSFQKIVNLEMQGYIKKQISN